MTTTGNTGSRSYKENEKAAQELEAAKVAALPKGGMTHEEKSAQASEVSRRAQKRDVRGPEEVGNEFVPDEQANTAAVETTPKVDPGKEPKNDEGVRETGASTSRTASARKANTSDGGTTAVAADKPAPTRKYRVGGAGIHTAEGKKKPGEVVNLTAPEARAFNKAKAILPYIPEEGEDDEGEE